MTALLGSTTVTFNVAVWAEAAAGSSASDKTRQSLFISLLLRERVRLERRIHRDGLERPLFGGLAVHGARDVVREHHAADRLVVVEEHVDVDQLGRRHVRERAVFVF